MFLESLEKWLNLIYLHIRWSKMEFNWHQTKEAIKPPISLRLCIIKYWTKFNHYFRWSGYISMSKFGPFLLKTIPGTSQDGRHYRKSIRQLNLCIIGCQRVGWWIIWVIVCQMNGQTDGWMDWWIVRWIDSLSYRKTKVIQFIAWNEWLLSEKQTLPHTMSMN